MKSRYWRTNAWKPDSVLLAVRRLAPCVCNRDAASAWLSPTATSTPNFWATSLASIPAIGASGLRSVSNTTLPVGRGGARPR